MTRKRSSSENSRLNPQSIISKQCIPYLPRNEITSNALTCLCFCRKAADSKQNAKEILLEENRCACCLKPFFVGRGVRCNDCGARSCRKGCTRWDTTDNAWHCLFCRQQRFPPRYFYTLRDFRASFASSKVLRSSATNYRKQDLSTTKIRTVSLTKTVFRFWLSKNGLQTSGGPLEEQDLHRYFDTAKSRVYVAGSFVSLFRNFKHSSKLRDGIS